MTNRYIPKHKIEELLGSGSNRIRTTCPNCNTSNILTITRVNSRTILYHCYSNSCNTKGVHTVKPHLQELSKDIINAKGVKKDVEPMYTRYELPSYLISGISLEGGLEWLYENGAIPAYKQGLYRVWSDPRERRLCIPLYHKGVLVNLMGRAIESGVKPKVRIYNQLGIVPPFVCGKIGTPNPHVVLVEDFASACMVSQVKGCVGVALLGTSINKQVVIPVLQELKPYTLSVALDRDAFTKALTIADELRYMFTQVRVIPLHDDIKRMPLDKVKELLYVESVGVGQEGY